MHNLLRSLPPEKKRKWPEYLPELLYAYNIVPHASTSYSLYYLMFGRNTRLPVDLMLGADEKDPPETDWLASHQDRLRDAYLKAGEHLRQQADAPKAISDKGTNDQPIEKGQFVYLRSHPRGRNKIQDAWDPTLYKVQETPGPTGAVYTVAPAHGDGPSKRVYRTLMRPCHRQVQPCLDTNPIVQTDLIPPRVRHNRVPTEPQDDEEEIIVMRRRPHPVLNTAPPEPCEPVNPLEESETNEPPVPEMPIEVTPGDQAPYAEPEVDEPTVPVPPVAETPEEPVHVEHPAPEPPEETTLRRSTRTTAGQHSNPHGAPRSAVNNSVTLTVKDFPVYFILLFWFLAYSLW